MENLSELPIPPKSLLNWAPPVLRQTPNSHPQTSCLLRHFFLIPPKQAHSRRRSPPTMLHQGYPYRAIWQFIEFLGRVTASSSLLLFYFLFFNFIYLFIYLWLCWVFVSVRGLSLVAASGGHSSSRCTGLSLSWPHLLRSTGSRCTGSAIVAHGPSCSAACGIFPDQGSNPCPLHWQADSQPLRHQGSPAEF